MKKSKIKTNIDLKVVMSLLQKPDGYHVIGNTRYHILSGNIVDIEGIFEITVIEDEVSEIADMEIVEEKGKTQEVPGTDVVEIVEEKGKTLVDFFTDIDASAISTSSSQHTLELKDTSLELESLEESSEQLKEGEVLDLTEKSPQRVAQKPRSQIIEGDLSDDSDSVELEELEGELSSDDDEDELNVSDVSSISLEKGLSHVFYKSGIEYTPRHKGYTLVGGDINQFETEMKNMWKKNSLVLSGDKSVHLLLDSKTGCITSQISLREGDQIHLYGMIFEF